MNSGLYPFGSLVCCDLQYVSDESVAVSVHVDESYAWEAYLNVRDAFDEELRGIANYYFDSALVVVTPGSAKITFVGRLKKFWRSTSEAVRDLGRAVKKLVKKAMPTVRDESIRMGMHQVAQNWPAIWQSIKDNAYRIFEWVGQVSTNVSWG